MEPLGRSEVVLLVELDEDELEDVLLEDDELLVDFEDELEEDGVGEGVEVDDALEDDAAAGLESVESDCPELKTVMYAIAPFGAVTTQKLPPPAPVAELGLVTWLTLLTAGSIEHGRPLQAPSGSQVIFRPQFGADLENSESSQIGFHANLTNVSPSATWLAPET